MRLQLLGTYTLEEFQAAIASIFEDFESNQINSVRNINIYLQPCAGNRIVRLFENEDEVEHMIYDFAKQKKVAMVSATLSVAKSHKVKPKEKNDEL